MVGNGENAGFLKMVKMSSQKLNLYNFLYQWLLYNFLLKIIKNGQKPFLPSLAINEAKVLNELYTLVLRIQYIAI